VAVGKILISANEAWNLVNFRRPIIEALLARGYEVVAAGRPASGPERELAKMGCRFYPLPIDSKGLSPRRDLATFLAYCRLFQRERPSVYLGMTVKPNVYGSLAARLCGVPVINNISGLGTAFIRTSWLTRLVESLYRLALARSHTIFFQNHSDRDLFVARRLVQRAQARLLPGSGVDLQYYSPSAEVDPEPDQGVSFLLIARLLRDKGVVEYVDAARLLKRSHPELQFRLLGFLGVENRTAIGREELEQWVCEGTVDYLGSSDDVRPHIAAADCVVLPSYREGTSRVLLEAAAMGKPLIATDVPGCRETLDPDVSGFLCDVRDAASLAEAMGKVARLTAQERLAMGAAGRAKMVQEFDQKIVVERYLQAIAEIGRPDEKPGARRPRRDHR
jgi:glycosyltransferase involved in cell wall biosynthesis